MHNRIAAYCRVQRGLRSHNHWADIDNILRILFGITLSEFSLCTVHFDCLLQAASTLHILHCRAAIFQWMGHRFLRASLPQAFCLFTLWNSNNLKLENFMHCLAQFPVAKEKQSRERWKKTWGWFGVVELVRCKNNTCTTFRLTTLEIILN